MLLEETYEYVKAVKEVFDLLIVQFHNQLLIWW